jgi:Replication protein
VTKSLKTKKQESPRRDAVSVACVRAGELREIAARIENAVASRSVERAEAGRFAGLCADEAEALGAATLMRQCGHVENVWHGEGLSSDAGESFEGFGVLYGCNVRLCPYCMNMRRRVSRARARDGMKQVRLANGEKWFLVTLTMPTLPANQASLFETMRVVYEAWGAFTKRGTWDSLARASIKGVEFTLGQRHQDEGRDWTPARDGYHVHIHLLAVARWIDVATLRREWSRCIKQTWEAHGIAQGINTKDGLAVCHARIVTNRKIRKSGSVISYEGALSEISKYITKAESFLTIPEEQLIDVACVRRWPRMFELLGACRAPRSKKGQQPEIPASAESAADYLDTENLSSAEVERNRQLKEALRATRPRAVPLRQRAFVSLLLGEWEKWGEELTEHVSDVRSYRRLMLSRRFPCATFRTLAGGLWYGAEANPAGAFETEDLHEHRQAHGDYMRDRRDELEEGAAFEAYQSELELLGRDRSELREMANGAEADEWHRYINGWKLDRRGGWEYNPDATNAQKLLRRQQHDRYQDAELVRAILFSQGRRAEWFKWITHPGSPMPDIRRPKGSA